MQRQAEGLGFWRRMPSPQAGRGEGRKKGCSDREGESLAGEGNARTHLLRLFLQASHFLNLIWGPVNTKDPQDFLACFCHGYFDWEQAAHGGGVYSA